MSETQKQISLNRAEVEGIRHVIAERDRRLREANDLDQYLRQLVAEVVTHRGEPVEAGWTLDLQGNKIVATIKPEPSTEEQP